MKPENYITQKSTEHSAELFCHQVTQFSENYTRPYTSPTLLAKTTVILQSVFTDKWKNKPGVTGSKDVPIPSLIMKADANLICLQV